MSSSKTPSSASSRWRFLSIHGAVCGVLVLATAVYVTSSAVSLGQGLIDYILMVAVASHVGVSSLGVLLALGMRPRSSWLWGIHLGTPLFVVAGTALSFAFREVESKERKRAYFEERERKMELPTDKVRLLDSWTRRSDDEAVDWVVDVEVSLPGRFDVAASRTGEDAKVWGECAPDRFQVSAGQPEGYRRQIACTFPNDASLSTDGWRFQIVEVGGNPRRQRAFVAVGAIPKKARPSVVEVSAPAFRAASVSPAANPSVADSGPER